MEQKVVHYMIADKFILAAKSVNGLLKTEYVHIELTVWVLKLLYLINACVRGNTSWYPGLLQCHMPHKGLCNYCLWAISNVHCGYYTVYTQHLTRSSIRVQTVHWMLPGSKQHDGNSAICDGILKKKYPQFCICINLVPRLVNKADMALQSHIECWHNHSF